MSRGYIGPPWWLMARGTGHYRTASGAIVEIDDAAVAPVKALTVGIEPVQDLHGYDAPWPAGGGANQWDEEWEVGSISGITGQNDPNSTTIRSKNYIPVLAETSYRYVNGNGTNAGGRYYDADKNFIGYETLSSVFTTPANCAYMRFVVLAAYGITYNHDIAINYPSSVTTYTPCSNICPISGWTGANVWDEATHDTSANPKITITFPAAAGTVYGGEMDVVNGKLRVTHAEVDLGTRSWAKQNESGFFVFYTSGIFQNAKIAPVICSQYKNASVNSHATLKENEVCWFNTTDRQITIRDTNYTDATTFKTAMSGVQLVYELATPIEYDLTPEQLTTLAGQNVVWSDVGPISLEYLSKSGNPALVALALARRDEEE